VRIESATPSIADLRRGIAGLIQDGRSLIDAKPSEWRQAERLFVHRELGRTSVLPRRLFTDRKTAKVPGGCAFRVAADDKAGEKRGA